MTVSGTEDTTSSPLGCGSASTRGTSATALRSPSPTRTYPPPSRASRPTSKHPPTSGPLSLSRVTCRIRPRSCSSTGVRRIDARVWIDDSPAPSPDTTNALLAAGMAATASMAVCASYAAGVVCCCGQPGRRQAHLVAAEIRRGLFTTAAHATDIPTRGGTYRARHAVGSDKPLPLTMTRSEKKKKNREWARCHCRRRAGPGRCRPGRDVSGMRGGGEQAPADLGGNKVSLPPPGLSAAADDAGGVRRAHRHRRGRRHTCRQERIRGVGTRRRRVVDPDRASIRRTRRRTGPRTDAARHSR